MPSVQARQGGGSSSVAEAVSIACLQLTPDVNTLSSLALHPRKDARRILSRSFAARLLELRENAGLTLRQLASGLNVDHTYLSHIENGRRTPPDDLICRIATYFRADADVLRLQAGQIPERLLGSIQRNPQLVLSFLETVDTSGRTEDYRFLDVRELLERHLRQQLPLGVEQPYNRAAFARHIDAGKNTPIYNAHSYHTKVPYQGIIPYIEHYTAPGDLVLDPFCGSGMTGVAAILAGRDALLNDLSPAAVHIAQNYSTPCDPESFERLYAQIAADLRGVQFQLYRTSCESCAGDAIIEYSIFTDIFGCSQCGSEINVWKHGRGANGKLLGYLVCPSCAVEVDKNDLEWIRSEPCRVSYTCLTGCAVRSERDANSGDFVALSAIAATPMTSQVPEAPFGESWEMWRQGHADRGINAVKDFFTARNLRALAAIKDWIEKQQVSRERAALLFAFTGCVNRASKRYQWNQKRPTNVLSGTLYVSSLFYEFNVFRLFERKAKAALRLFHATADVKGAAAVRLGSATELRELPTASVDYVFTDPPFGSNIFYSDCSLLWEAWLGDFTPRDKEIVVNKSLGADEGGKNLDAYRDLLTQSLREIRRVLKPERWASVVFHNSSAAVWEAVRSACIDAGFTLGSAVMFDKRHKSFKGLKGALAGESVVNYDVVLNLEKRTPLLVEAENAVASEARLVEMLREFLRTLPSAAVEQRSTAYLHSLAVQKALTENLHLGSIHLKSFERLLAQEFARTESEWRIRGVDEQQ